MSVPTLYEPPRGCGHRKAGGTYLVSDGVGISCDLLPVAAEVCPCCGGGIKPARGWTWVDPDQLLPHHVDTPTHRGCPLNRPGQLGDRAGLLWIGEAFYATPADWISEGRAMGFSRRVHNVPRGFVVGETWVVAAHRKAIARWDEDGETIVATPGIFHVWLPARIEYVIRGHESDEKLERLVERGITPVRVVPVQTAIEEGVTT